MIIKGFKVEHELGICRFAFIYTTNNNVPTKVVFFSEVTKHWIKSINSDYWIEKYIHANEIPLSKKDKTEIFSIFL